MNETRERKGEPRARTRHGFYSCAFCHARSPKPFKICESCGSFQPLPASEEE